MSSSEKQSPVSLLLVYMQAEVDGNNCWTWKGHFFPFFIVDMTTLCVNLVC